MLSLTRLRTGISEKPRTYATRLTMRVESADNYGSEYSARVRSRNHCLRATAKSGATSAILREKSPCIPLQQSRTDASCFVFVGFDAGVQKVRVFLPVLPVPPGFCVRLRHILMRSAPGPHSGLRGMLLRAECAFGQVSDVCTTHQGSANSSAGGTILSGNGTWCNVLCLD
jgi:hypothetical protein